MASIAAPALKVTSTSTTTTSPSYFGRLLHYWHPTSKAEQDQAEKSLLSRIPFFASPEAATGDDKTLRTEARVGPVDIGDGQFINTLWIEQTHSLSHEGDGSVGVDKAPLPTTPSAMEEEDLLLGAHPTPQTDLHLAVSRGTSPADTIPRARGPSDPKHTLVMTHGYGAGLGYFYRNYHSLSSVPNWRIYSIDWLGMGSSSRPPFSTPGRTEEERIREAESFFIDSLERWREAQNIHKMTLLGHSLGGYLSVAYALKYPERVDRLILVSPVGLPEADAAPPAEDLPAPEMERLGPRDASSPPTSGPRRQIPWFARKLWDANVTPMAIVRTVGPFGRSLVGRYVNFRMAFLDDADRAAMWDYTYHMCASRGSGEYALSRILAPGAYARSPLIHRLPRLSVPTTFIYGEVDWMDYRHAATTMPAMSVETHLERIPGGGHNMFLQSPVAFDECVRNEMLKVVSAEDSITA